MNDARSFLASPAVWLGGAGSLALWVAFGYWLAQVYA